jgi:hypothetical protein
MKAYAEFWQCEELEYFVTFAQFEKYLFCDFSVLMLGKVIQGIQNE